MKNSLLCALLLIFSFVLLNSPSQAATKDLASTCPEKVFEHGSFVAIYKGNDCGDMCYSTFQFQNNKEYTIVCGEEDSEKFFGKKENVPVNVEYDVLQSFFDPTGEGGNASCMRIDICKGGSVLKNKNVLLTENPDKIFCKEKILDTGSVSGLITEIEENEYNPKDCSIRMKLQNGDIYEIAMPCNQKNKYHEFLGHDVKLDYSVLQRFGNQENGGLCERKDMVRSIKLLD